MWGSFSVVQQSYHGKTKSQPLPKATGAMGMDLRAVEPEYRPKNEVPKSASRSEACCMISIAAVHPLWPTDCRLCGHWYFEVLLPRIVLNQRVEYQELQSKAKNSSYISKTPRINLERHLSISASKEEECSWMSVRWIAQQAPYDLWQVGWRPQGATCRTDGRLTV